MMLVRVRTQEPVPVVDMLPGDAFLMDGELYIRISEEAHGALVLNALHVDSGTLAAFDDDEEAVRRVIKLVEVE